ncbi:MAG: HPr family phosphocarrier protein [Myxococcales bacterium]|nr:HPr family phosphocarrier protein [Deltaproteobacteria bacterium]NNE18758.1 HPr family phosphocarrier protein [Myxococcales bacterium]
MTGTVEVPNRLGLHARAAAKLVNLANRFESQIEVSKADQLADAKSIMGVLLLCGGQGASITFRVSGPDARAALDALCALVADGFGELQ